MKGFVVFVVAIFSFSLSVLQVKSQKNEVIEEKKSTEIVIIKDKKLPENENVENGNQLNYDLIDKNKSRPSLSKNVKISQTRISKKQNSSPNQSESLIKSDQLSLPPLKNNNKLKPLNSLTTPLNGVRNKLEPLKTNSALAEN